MGESEIISIGSLSDLDELIHKNRVDIHNKETIDVIVRYVSNVSICLIIPLSCYLLCYYIYIYIQRNIGFKICILTFSLWRLEFIAISCTKWSIYKFWIVFRLNYLVKRWKWKRKDKRTKIVLKKSPSKVNSFTWENLHFNGKFRHIKTTSFCVFIFL